MALVVVGIDERTIHDFQNGSIPKVLIDEVKKLPMPPEGGSVYLRPHGAILLTGRKPEETRYTMYRLYKERW
ncbi:MAG: hypothetical protein UU93_C0010G0026 [Candidatus Amesbacteria bacterium GW2011_GWA2_42_12]|uniref:Uncharacterized protein n=1 Tax=Candidatus Amesbacteria bacterium GW2011_GWA2_42_12 TaxID=1618356 RepID=A0A0G0Y5Z3_9BACT|nr:MAG: hypothetical protein UU93_C0010G0026 [Candidatus Amesbacteria bacterium GW2011_GWA2_42_12]